MGRKIKTENQSLIMLLMPTRMEAMIEIYNIAKKINMAKTEQKQVQTTQDMDYKRKLRNNM